MSSDKSFLKQRIDGHATLPSGINPITGQTPQEQLKFRVPDGGKGDYELKFYIKDQGSIMDSTQESEFGGPRDDEYVDFSDRCEIDGKNSLVNIGTITHSIEGRRPNSFKTNTQTLKLSNDDYFWDIPLQHSLFTINGNKAFFEPSSGKENNSWFRREVKITLRQAEGEISTEKDLGHFLIETLATDSESGVANLKVIGLEKPLIEKDADTVKDGKRWFKNKKVKFLVEELLKTVYRQIINEKEVLRDGDIVSVKSFKDESEIPIFTDYGKPVESLNSGICHTLVERILVNTTVVATTLTSGDTAMTINGDHTLHLRKGDVITLGTNDIKGEREKVELLNNSILNGINTDIITEPISFDYSGTISVIRNMLYLGVSGGTSSPENEGEIWALDPDRQEFKQLKTYQFFKDQATSQSDTLPVGLIIRKLFYDKNSNFLIGLMSKTMDDTSGIEVVNSAFFRLNIIITKRWDDTTQLTFNRLRIEDDTDANKERLFPSNIQYRNSLRMIEKSLVDKFKTEDSLSSSILENNANKLGSNILGQSEIVTLLIDEVNDFAIKSEITRSDISHLLLQGGNALFNSLSNDTCSFGIFGGKIIDIDTKVLLHGDIFPRNQVYDFLSLANTPIKAGENVTIPMKQKVNVVKDTSVSPALLFDRNSLTDIVPQPTEIEVPDSVPKKHYAMINRSVELNITLKSSDFTEDFYIYEHEFPDTRSPDGKFRKVKATNIITNNLGINVSAQGVMMGNHFLSTFLQLYSPIITPVIAVYFDNALIGCLCPRYAIWVWVNFTVTGVAITPSIGDTYLHNSTTYVITKNSVSGELEARRVIGGGDTKPLSIGILSRLTGIGDLLISFTSVIPVEGQVSLNTGIVVFSQNSNILSGVPTTSKGGVNKNSGDFTDLYQIHNGRFDSSIADGKYIALDGFDEDDPFDKNGPSPTFETLLAEYFRGPTDFSVKPEWQFVWFDEDLPTNFSGKVRLECCMNVNSRLDVKAVKDSPSDNPPAQDNRFSSIHLGVNSSVTTSHAMHFGMIGPNHNGTVETDAFFKIPATSASSGFVNIPMGQSIGSDTGGIDAIELIDPSDIDKINLKIGTGATAVFVTRYFIFKDIADKKIRSPVHYMLSRRAGLSFKAEGITDNALKISSAVASGNRLLTIESTLGGIINWYEQDIDLTGAFIESAAGNSVIFNIRQVVSTNIILCFGIGDAGDDVKIIADTHGSNNGVRLFGPLDSSDYCKVYSSIEDSNKEAFALGIIRGGLNHSDLGFKAGIALGNDHAFAWNINNSDVINFFTKKNDKTDFNYFLKTYNFFTNVFLTIHTISNNGKSDPIHEREVPYNAIKDNFNDVYFNTVLWADNISDFAINKVLKFDLDTAVFSTIWESFVDTHSTSDVEIGTSLFFTSLSLDSDKIISATVLLVSTALVRAKLISDAWEVNEITSTNSVVRLQSLFLFPINKIREHKSLNNFYDTVFYWMQSGLQTVIFRGTIVSSTFTSVIVANGNPPIFGDQGELADFTIIDNLFEELFGASQRFIPTLDALVLGDESIILQYHVWKLSQDFGGIIPLADFTGLKVWDALGLLAEASNSVMGFDPNGRFFFLQRKLELEKIKSVFLIDNIENNNLISIKKVLDYKKIFNTIEVIPHLPLIDNPKVTVIPSSTLDKIRIPFNGINPVQSEKEVSDQRGITSERPDITANQMDEERKTLILSTTNTGEDEKDDSGYTSKFKWKIVTDLIRLRTVKIITGLTDKIVVNDIPLDDSKTNIQFEDGDTIFIGQDERVIADDGIKATTNTITLKTTVENKIIGTDVIIASKNNDQFRSLGDGLSVAGGYTYSPHEYFLEVGDWYYGSSIITTFVFKVSGINITPDIGAIYKDDTATRSFEILSTNLDGSGNGTINAKIIIGIINPSFTGVLTKVSGSGAGDDTILYSSFSTLAKTFFDEVGPSASEEGKRESNQYNPTEVVPEKFYRINGALSTALNYFWIKQTGIRSIDNVTLGVTGDPEVDLSFQRDRLRTFIELKFVFNSHRFQVGDLIEVVAQGLVLRRNETSKQTRQDFDSFRIYGKRELSLNNRFISIDFALLLMKDLLKKYKNPQYSLTIKGLNNLNLNLLDVITVLHNKMFIKLVEITDKEGRKQNFPGIKAEIEKITFDLKNQGIMSISARSQKINGF